MKNIAEQKCQACGGPLRFDPAKGKLVCDYCGSEYEIEEQQVQEPEGKKDDNHIDGFNFENLNAQAADSNAANLPVYVCKSCGAEIIARAEEVSLTCPYCRNNIVLTDKVSGNLRPDGVVPFRITTENLSKAVKEFYKDKILLPKDFFSESKMSNITGVYVPFWVFNGKMEGRLSFEGTSSRSHREGDYIVTDTDHYDLERNMSIEFADVPVDASDRIEDDLMDSIEPFNMDDCKPFDMSYLAGYTADRFDVAKDDIAERAKERMLTSADNKAREMAGAKYESVRRTGGRFKASLTAKYILLPVYMFSLKYNGMDYSFAVNGQTGKVVGNIPTGKSESRAYFMKRAGIVAAVIIGAAIVGFFMGV